MSDLRTGCRIRVPATTANLGPGFDCLGLALDLWNEVSFSLEGASVVVETSGGNSEDLPRDESNLIARAFLRLCREAGRPQPAGLLISSRADIPLASGLGSSSSAIVAGLLGANTLLGRPLDRAALLELAADIEGHPDNVAAALLGGLTIVVQKSDRLLTKKILVPEVHVALAVPELAFSTRTARAGLPEQVTMKDAVFNLQRTPLVVEALRTGDYELLSQVMDDRLHQAARLKLIPGGRAAWLAAQHAGRGRGGGLWLGTEPDRLREPGHRRGAGRPGDGRRVHRRGCAGAAHGAERLGRRRHRRRLTRRRRPRASPDPAGGDCPRR